MNLPVQPVSTLLPVTYRRRLILAAANRDLQQIDNITDELAACYPQMVRQRGDVGLLRPESVRQTIDRL